MKLRFSDNVGFNLFFINRFKCASIFKKCLATAKIHNKTSIVEKIGDHFHPKKAFEYQNAIAKAQLVRKYKIQIPDGK